MTAIINVLSGVHGTLEGTVEPDVSLLAEDLAAYANVPGVTVYDFMQLTASEVSSLLSSTATTIGAFCDSVLVLRRLCDAMPYFEDFTSYSYGSTISRPNTLTVGWLGRGHDFEVEVPGEQFLSNLWKFCSISVARTRGIYECDICDISSRRRSYKAERNGERLLLGYSEIRVFSNAQIIYAAPTLIYHYVSVHHYKPPEEFVAAVLEGPTPPDPQYFDLLNEHGLEWQATSPFMPDSKRVRFVRVSDGASTKVIRLEEQDGCHLPPEAPDRNTI